MEWPEWWEWELDISSHAMKRMPERHFDEPTLRAMLEDATGLSEQVHGTFIVESHYESRRWEIIVSPDYEKQVIVIVTAYPDP
jgi:Domain of unknown function (DUF4258)